jgi:tetratricopeptide (TPR) repeat protein
LQLGKDADHKKRRCNAVNFNKFLNDKAKEILITAIHSSSTKPADKAKALYLLGEISFEEERIKVALDDWRALEKDYPDSPEGKEIKERLSQLSEVISKFSDSTVNSAVASSYLSNGDFWSKGDKIFTIDSSWLPKVELANQWYDRVIQEFPKSDAAESAYERKLFTLLGTHDRSSEDDSTGVKANYSLYMPQVLSTFAAFETDFPTDSSLQAFRYQIAQAYWSHRDWANTRHWLQTIIDRADGKTTFYTQAAKARLNKIEY